MSNNLEVTQKPQMVYCAVSYGRVLAVYAKAEDAMQFISTCVAKNRPCDLVIQNVL